MGKKSVVLDLKDALSLSALLELLQTADVLLVRGRGSRLGFGIRGQGSGSA